MSKSMITHAAALEALATLHLAAAEHIAGRGFGSGMSLPDAMSKAAHVLIATANATPAEVYCHLKQAKAAAKAKLKAGQI
jgi:hypothetical protein